MTTPLTEDSSHTQVGLSLGDYRKIITRRRWSFLLPCCVVGFAGAITAYFWPLTYKSDALILIEQQKVPTQYVKPNVVSDLQARLDTMTQQILSRTRIQKLIDDFHLYADERNKETMEDLVDKMRANISVQPVQSPGRQDELTAFRISYSARSADTAQRVTNELTSLFIEVNLRSRAADSASTTAFLRAELDAAAAELSAQEHRLQEFKMKNLGQLPEQLATNLQVLASLQGQLQAVSNELEHAEQQKVYLTSIRSEYEMLARASDDAGAPVISGDGTLHSSDLMNAEATLRDLKKRYLTLTGQYTSEFPDVIETKKEIAHWQSVVAQLRAATVKRPGAPTPARTASGASSVSSALLDSTSRLKALDLEIAAHKRDEAALQKQIAALQNRLKQTPMLEQQFAEISRDCENARSNYQSLLQKQQQSELATQLEQRQQGEQFRVLDPAKHPDKALPPNRLQIVLIGWVLGLIAGLGWVVLREFLDPTIRGKSDLALRTELPVLACIPNYLNPAQERWRRWRLRLEFTVGVVLVLGVIGSGIRSILRA
jgi:succinoglycan biosynthesis transport protein ExoP